jgi:hypothetical protein
MEWRRLGKIFDPTEHRLPNNCREFAQSPQALVFDDFIRIYFSTRAVDQRNGKYLSHVAYVDFDRELRVIRDVSDHEVIPLGELGCFDEHGIFPMHVFRDGDSLLAYTTGWSRRVAVSVETSIGIARSIDGGRTFQREGPGPILSSSLNEPYLVGDGFVRRVDATYHMWYIFGTAWKRSSPTATAERTYKIGHATSLDGRHWIKDEARQVVPDRLGPEESQALPTVVEVHGRYHMFFCYRESVDFRTNPSRGYRIGHAFSDDLKSWSRDDASLGLGGTPGTWDSDMACYPHAFRIDDRVWMLYNGNEFGRYGFGAAVLEW